MDQHDLISENSEHEDSVKYYLYKEHQSITQLQVSTRFQIPQIGKFDIFIVRRNSCILIMLMYAARGRCLRNSTKDLKIKAYYEYHSTYHAVCDM